MHSHDQKFGRPIARAVEVCGAKSKNNNNLWFAAEGGTSRSRSRASTRTRSRSGSCRTTRGKDDDDGEELMNEAAKEDLKNEKKKKKVEL